MNLKSPLNPFKKNLLAWFWIICFLTVMFTCISIVYLSSITNFETPIRGPLIFSFLTVYEVIVMSLMPNHIIKHLSEFRPTLDLTDLEYKDLQKRFLSTTISIEKLWLLILTILLSNVFFVFYNHQLELLGTIALIYLIITSFFMLQATSRVLWCVYKLQYFPLKVNILNTKSLLTLSQLTQKFALYLIPVTTLFGWVSLSSRLSNDPNSIDVLALVVFVILTSLGPLLLILSICSFVLPVLWVRQLIIERKRQALSNITQKLLASFHEHDRMVEAGDLSNINAITTSINALTSRAEIYKKISELPWEIQTLREFSGAVFFPIVLWIIQYYLGSFFVK